MTQQIINLGNGPDTQTGDNLYVAFNKVNDNFTELYSVFDGNGISYINANVVIANTITTHANLRSGNIFTYGNIEAIGYLVTAGAFYPNGEPIGSLSTITSNLAPLGTNIYTLGTVNQQWLAGYISTLYSANVYGTLLTPAQPFITQTGTLSNLTANVGRIYGNLVVEGNLSVEGNVTFFNVDNLLVEDPIISLNTGANGGPLTFDNGFDSGAQTFYYDTENRKSFFGRKANTGYFEYYSNVESDIGNIISGTYGTVKTGNLILTQDANISGNVSGNFFLGNGRFLTGIDTTLIASGNSNVKVYSDSNVSISAAGVANVAEFTAIGGNITGDFFVTGTLKALQYIGNVSGNLSAPGLNTQVIFNDNSTAGATSGFLFDKFTNVVTVANGVTTGNIRTASNTNLTLAPTGNGIVKISSNNGGAIGISMGTPSQGNLVSNAVALTIDSSITNSIAQLNFILGKLVPPPPTDFPGGQGLSIQSLSTYRMCDFVQTDNTPGANKSVAAGTSVTVVRRSASYNTNTIANVGPGDAGNVTGFLNGANVGTVTLTGNSNGTYSNLIISRNMDYNNVISTVTPGFWFVFSSNLIGTVPAGWNEAYISHSIKGNTNSPTWYYDASTPGAPVFSNLSINLTTNSSSYSSTIPHLNSGSQWNITGNISRLSGDMFPNAATSNAYAFITGASGGGIAAPTSVTYSQAGINYPLERNLYVANGSAYFSTNASGLTGFGYSTNGPVLNSNNGYGNGTSGSISPGYIVLYKTGTGNQIEETSIPITSVGTGSGNGVRVINPGNISTPAITSNAAFNSQTSTLETFDATVVGAILKHDETDYSAGYLPIGPNLSIGRSNPQYFTFRFTRTVVSKFDVSISGSAGGIWVALPGSSLDTTSSLNGWLDLSIPYAGSGIPGANTGAGGNGSNGCALGGVFIANSSGNQSKTVTFGTVSSSSTSTNEIFVRVKLYPGQTVTSLNIQAATN